MKKIRKAVFPVAGMGSRFLPATKASPKEMMPVVDKPLIQYAVEEAVGAGITDMIFITGRNKRAIEDHFDRAAEFEAELEYHNKRLLLEALRAIPGRDINCIYIRQPEPLGLGHAVLCARPVINDEPFAVILADDLLDTPAGMKGVIAQMSELYEQQGCSILGVQDVPREQTSSYGIVKTAANDASKIQTVTGIVEKPKPEAAPSILGVVGRYVLTPHIFDYLATIGTGSGGEIQLTDGIAALLADEKVLAYRYDGTRYDCGSKLGYLKATLELGRKHPEIGSAFNAYLRDEVAHTLKKGT